MMRIGNNRHRPWYLSMESGVNLTPIKGVLLANGRIRTQPMWAKCYVIRRVSLFSILIFQIDQLP